MKQTTSQVVLEFKSSVDETTEKLKALYEKTISHKRNTAITSTASLASGLLLHHQPTDNSQVGNRETNKTKRKENQNGIYQIEENKTTRADAVITLPSFNVIPVDHATSPWTSYQNSIEENEDDIIADLNRNGRKFIIYSIEKNGAPQENRSTSPGLETMAQKDSVNVQPGKSSIATSPIKTKKQDTAVQHERTTVVMRKNTTLKDGQQLRENIRPSISESSNPSSTATRTKATTNGSGKLEIVSAVNSKTSSEILKPHQQSLDVSSAEEITMSEDMSNNGNISASSFDLALKTIKVKRKNLKSLTNKSIQQKSSLMANTSQKVKWENKNRKTKEKQDNVASKASSLPSNSTGSTSKGSHSLALQQRMDQQKVNCHVNNNGSSLSDPQMDHYIYHQVKDLENVQKEMQNIQQNLMKQQIEISQNQHSLIHQQSTIQMNTLQNLHEQQLNWQFKTLEKYRTLYQQEISGAMKSQSELLVQMKQDYHVALQAIQETAPLVDSIQEMKKNISNNQSSLKMDINDTESNANTKTTRKNTEMEIVESTTTATSNSHVAPNMKMWVPEASSLSAGATNHYSSSMRMNQSIFSGYSTSLACTDTFAYKQILREVQGISGKTKALIHSIKKQQEKANEDENLLETSLDPYDQVIEKKENLHLGSTSLTKKIDPREQQSVTGNSKITKTSVSGNSVSQNPKQKHPLQTSKHYHNNQQDKRPPKSSTNIGSTWKAHGEPSSPVASDRVISGRSQSPSRPPPFYNVRLSSQPIFLRRTSIKPPAIKKVVQEQYQQNRVATRINTEHHSETERSRKVATHAQERYYDDDDGPYYETEEPESNRQRVDENRNRIVRETFPESPNDNVYHGDDIDERESRPKRRKKRVQSPVKATRATSPLRKEILQALPPPSTAAVELNEKGIQKILYSSSSAKSSFSETKLEISKKKTLVTFDEAVQTDAIRKNRSTQITEFEQSSQVNLLSSFKTTESSEISHFSFDASSVLSKTSKLLDNKSLMATGVQPISYDKSKSTQFSLHASEPSISSETDTSQKSIPIVTENQSTSISISTQKSAYLSRTASIKPKSPLLLRQKIDTLMDNEAAWTVYNYLLDQVLFNIIKSVLRENQPVQERQQQKTEIVSPEIKSSSSSTSILEPIVMKKKSALKVRKEIPVVVSSSPESKISNKKKTSTPTMTVNEDQMVQKEYKLTFHEKSSSSDESSRSVVQFAEPLVQKGQEPHETRPSAKTVEIEHTEDQQEMNSAYSTTSSKGSSKKPSVPSSTTTPSSNHTGSSSKLSYQSSFGMSTLSTSMSEGEILSEVLSEGEVGKKLHSDAIISLIQKYYPISFDEKSPQESKVEPNLSAAVTLNSSAPRRKGKQIQETSAYLPDQKRQPPSKPNVSHAANVDNKTSADKEAGPSSTVSSRLSRKAVKILQALNEGASKDDILASLLSQSSSSSSGLGDTSNTSSSLGEQSRAEAARDLSFGELDILATEVARRKQFLKKSKTHGQQEDDSQHSRSEGEVLYDFQYDGRQTIARDSRIESSFHYDEDFGAIPSIASESSSVYQTPSKYKEPQTQYSKIQQKQQQTTEEQQQNSKLFSPDGQTIASISTISRFSTDSSSIQSEQN